MSRLALSLMVLTIAFAASRGEPSLTGALLRQYDMAFAGLGAGIILFLVLVVASAGGGPAVPRFRPVTAPDSSARCPVCASGGRERWVACTRCETPHHRECVRYAARCAVFGCSGDAGVDPKVAKS